MWKYKKLGIESNMNSNNYFPFACANVSILVL